MNISQNMVVTLLRRKSVREVVTNFSFREAVKILFFLTSQDAQEVMLVSESVSPS